MTIRSIYVLTHDEIRQMARDQADAGEPMAHGFEAGSAQAVSFEHAYQGRRAELEEVEG